MTEPEPRKFRVRLWHLLFLFVLVITSFALAWWQWTRFKSGSGTFQNLGYAMQWPFFGAFFVIAYRKFVAYENERYKSDDEIYEEPKDPETITEIDPDFLPQRTQLSVEEFNALNQQRRGDTTQGA
ncbi:MAG: hypothetical protein Q3976_08210 [Corynebacterium sp.]|nr:hypothetical protein [Corynebacterium sp.]